MSKSVLILFAACVGLSLLSLHLVKQMRAGQAKVTELQAQIADLERQRQETPPPSAPLAVPEPIVQPPQAVPPPATPAIAAVTATVKRPPPPADAMFASGGPSREERMRLIREAQERQRQLMQDPEYREAMRIQQRSNMNRQYPGVARELGLTAEQTEQLFDLLVDQQMRQNEQMQPMWDTENVDPAALQQRQQKMQQQWTEMQQKNDAELAATLGADKVQAWKDYQSTLGARHQAEHLRSTLAGRGVPLDEDASRAVVKAFADAQKAEMQEYANMARANAANGYAVKGGVAFAGRIGTSAEMYERQIENTKKRNQRVLEALSPYLTYEQRETLQKEQEAELKMQEAQMRMMRAQSKIDGGSNDGGWVTNSMQGLVVPIQ